MSVQAPTSDADVLDLLRINGGMGVNDLADAMDVTPTAVRQRLTRLMRQGLVGREAIRHGRGRPRHAYELTDKGLRLTGSNFSDLALVLWREIGSIKNLDVREELLPRVASALASQYADQVQGETTAERMQSLSDLLNQRRLPTEVDQSNCRPVLRTHACPYPNLAENDETVCDMERMLFSKLLGREVELTQCRLDGACRCEFRPTEEVSWPTQSTPSMAPVSQPSSSATA
jgi:predicted ArsR family transcriptional regulator